MILWGVLIGLAVGAVAIFLYIRKRNKDDEVIMTSAKNQSRQIIENANEKARQSLIEAQKQAENAKKEEILKAKEEILQERNKAEDELRERRKEVSRQENRLNQKEENIDRKVENLEKKEQLLQEKLNQADQLKDEIQVRIDSEVKVLEKISGYTMDEAKSELLNRAKELITHQKALQLQEFEANYREDADEKAKSILALAIQKCSSDYVAEVAISTVTLPNEEVKGKIIGREGRNIRSIEQLTGVELIVDDTPEVITISCFDSVRREIARLALEKLIADGRIHPARIEEMVEKAKKEVENAMKHAGEQAVFETGVHGLHPELLKLLGRLKYRTSYGQNVLRHSIEVSLLAGNIANEMGIDPTAAKRAGLLHDIGKALTQEVEGSHIQLGVDVAKKFHEGKDIVHAIESHHGDVEAVSYIDFIIQAADAISAARPGARREDMENYIKRLQKLEEIANEFKGVEKSFAIQAGREVRIMVKPEEVTDDQLTILAHDIATKIENDLEYPGQIKINVIRENRVTDYAK